MDLFDLVAKISLDSQNFEKGISNAEKATSSLGNKLKTGFATAAKVGAAAIGAVTAASAAMTKTIIDGTKEVAAYGDEIDKNSQKMGISAEAYQEWDAVLQHSGASIDTLERAMPTLAKKLEKGDKAFEQLGLSVDELKGLSQEEIFAKTIEALQNMEAGTERTVLAQRLLGGSAKQLGALLNTSAEDTQKMKDRVHELGGVMSDDAVKAAAKYQDSLQDMQTALSGAKRKLISDFLPSVTTVMDGLTELFAGNSDKGIGLINDGIKSFVDNLSKSLPKILPVIQGLVSSLGGAILDNAETIINSAMQLIVQLSGAIIQSFPVIIDAVVENLPWLVQTITDALVENLPTLVAGAVQLFMGLVEAIPQIIPALVGALPQIVSAIFSGLAAPLQNIFGTVWNNIKASASQAWETLKNGAVSAWNGIKSVFSTVASFFGDIFSKAWTKVKEVFSKGGKIFSGIKEGIVDAFKAVVNVIIKGINTVIALPLNGLNSILDTIQNVSFLGISPFGWLTWRAPIPEIPLLAKGGVVKNPTIAMLGERGREAVVPLENNTEWTKKMADQIVADMSGGENGLFSGIANIVESVMQNMQLVVVLDDGTLVGRIDKSLGRMSLAKARGN